tara:strand:- start:1056 stop:1526 length:471 start_codon:yes stop_codon:yes gene_type:complete
MIRVFSLCVIMLLVPGLAWSTVPDTVDTTEIEIQQCLLSIQKAAENLDVDSVFSFVLENDNGALIENGRLLLTREDAIENTRGGFRGVKHINYKFDQEHITLLSDDLALVVSDGLSHVELEDGRVFKTAFAQSVLLKRVEGEWKVLHAHRSIPNRL